MRELRDKLAAEYGFKAMDSTCAEELHFGCVARDAFKAGYDARDHEVAILREALENAAHNHLMGTAYIQAKQALEKTGM